MILDENLQQTGKDNFTGAKSAFTIEANSAAFKILTDKLYQYPIRAIVRELSSNAIDANIAAGKEPGNFTIKVPSYSDNTFAIIDSGTGMSYDDIMNVYTSFFSSTKSGSNDQTGMFGLGSKTPFAYTKSFTIESTKDGEKNIFSAFTNDAGTPSVTHIMKVPSAGNGTKISFSVEDVDIVSFWKEIIYCIPAMPKVPTLVDYSDFEKFVKSYKITYAEEWADLYTFLEFWNTSFKGSELPSHNMTSSFARVNLEMGNVIYNVKVEDSQLLSMIDVLNINKVMLHADIGKVSITPNREELQYDEKTNEYIHTSLANFLLEKAASNLEGTFRARLSFYEITNFISHFKDSATLATSATKDLFNKVNAIIAADKEAIEKLRVKAEAINLYGRTDVLAFKGPRASEIAAVPRYVSLVKKRSYYGSNPAEEFFQFMQTIINGVRDCEAVVIPLTAEEISRSSIEGVAPKGVFFKNRLFSILKTHDIPGLIFVRDDFAKDFAEAFNLNVLDINFTKVKNAFKVKVEREKTVKVDKNTVEDIYTYCIREENGTFVKSSKYFSVNQLLDLQKKNKVFFEISSNNVASNNRYSCAQKVRDGVTLTKHVPAKDAVGGHVYSVYRILETVSSAGVNFGAKALKGIPLNNVYVVSMPYSKIRHYELFKYFEEFYNFGNDIILTLFDFLLKQKKGKVLSPFFATMKQPQFDEIAKYEWPANCYFYKLANTNPDKFTEASKIRAQRNLLTDVFYMCNNDSLLKERGMQMSSKDDYILKRLEAEKVADAWRTDDVILGDNKEILSKYALLNYIYYYVSLSNSWEDNERTHTNFKATETLTEIVIREIARVEGATLK